MDQAIRVTAEAAAASKVVSLAEVFPKEQGDGRENINKLLQLGGLDYEKEEDEVMEINRTASNGPGSRRREEGGRPLLK